MAAPFVVPLKGVEIPFDDNANQLKPFLDISLLFYISHYLEHVLYQKHKN